jgi:signal transduction histidine kinase/DNA-binding response OmpR family regulator
LVDRKILSDQYTAFIGADNEQIGKDAGIYISKLLNGKGNIVEICGLEGSTPASERHRGFIDVISRYPDIHILHSVDGAWLKSTAENKMEEILAACPEIDAVYAHNDRMATGAYNAAHRQNRSDNIYFIGIDALPGKGGGIEQVLNKQLKVTFIYPTNGEKIIQLVMNILQDKPYEKNNTLYTNVVDETNAQILKLQTDAIIEQEGKIKFLDTQMNAFLVQYTTQRYLFLSAVFVIFLFIAFFILLFRAYHTKNRLNIELEKRNHEISEQKALTEQQRDQLIELSKQLEEATHAKLVFFTNISHEFRTPLTLIAGTTSSLLAEKAFSAEHRKLLMLAQKNVGVLMKLIDQIIDFRKYENGKLELKLNSNNLYHQVVEWNELFEEWSKKKHLNFEFHVAETHKASPSDDFQMVYDAEKMERIYFNLLSNAFKFTPERGFISVMLDKTSKENGDCAILRISNSGKGISKHDIQNIFERFYQVDSHVAGSGIGLALVKAFVELHQGEIYVSSDEISGMTTFTVIIPFLSNEYGKYYNQPPQNNDNEYINEADETGDDASWFEERNKDKDLILVIDDNPDIRSYIKMVLQNRFTVMEAIDGMEGFQKAVKYIPDVIVSDVMMPPPDGVELCRQLKKEFATGHIPVILLTACSLDEQRIAGFESGADDYIAKPFNSNVLEARIRNLIENRKQMKEAFQKGLFSSNGKEIMNESDKSFIGKLRSLIEEKLSDTALNVEDLGQDVGLSRSQLYRKVKSLTGYSPNELLRLIRLKKAHTLLSSSELNVSEIAYDTGFTSSSYFSKCFKDHYKESPTDYLKRINNVM